MKTRTATIAFCLAIASGVVISLGAQQLSAGYQSQRIVDDARKRPIHLDIWYPTAAQPEQPHRYGLSIGRVVPGGELAGERLPVVLLSHGAMGSATNYSWLAEHLARRGYVVLGVSHIGESPVFGADSLDPAAVGRFGDRTQDLNTALAYLLERSPFTAGLTPLAWQPSAIRPEEPRPSCWQASPSPPRTWRHTAPQTRARKTKAVNIRPAMMRGPSSRRWRRPGV